MLSDASLSDASTISFEMYGCGIRSGEQRLRLLLPRQIFRWLLRHAGMALWSLIPASTSKLLGPPFRVPGTPQLQTYAKGCFNRPR